MPWQDIVIEKKWGFLILGFLVIVLGFLLFTNEMYIVDLEPYAPVAYVSPSGSGAIFKWETIDYTPSEIEIREKYGLSGWGSYVRGYYQKGFNINFTSVDDKFDINDFDRAFKEASHSGLALKMYKPVREPKPFQEPILILLISVIFLYSIICIKFGK